MPPQLGDILPTVRIVNPRAKETGSPYLIINAGDFDEKKHKRFDDSTYVSGKALEAPKSRPFDEGMTRPELMEVGKRLYGLDMNPRASKDSMLEALEQSFLAKLKE